MTDDLRQRARDLIKFQRTYGSVAIANVVDELLAEAELMREQCDWQCDRTDEQIATLESKVEDCWRTINRIIGYVNNHYGLIIPEQVICPPAASAVSDPGPDEPERSAAR